MARKKSLRPKKVNIYFDRLTLQLGFMSNEQAGILLKLIVAYSMGDVQTVDQIKNELDKNECNKLILMAFEENRIAIDEDLKAYAETCERRQKAAEEREAKRRAQDSTTDHNCAQEDTKCTNTNTITNTNTKTNVSKDTGDCIGIVMDDEEEDKAEKKEEKLQIISLDSFVNLWNNAYQQRIARLQATNLKLIEKQELPEDAEERINKALVDITANVKSSTLKSILDTHNVIPADRNASTAAKFYLKSAIENMAAVRMKPKDTRFGSFVWLFNGNITRIKKLYNHEIQ